MDLDTMAAKIAENATLALRRGAEPGGVEFWRTCAAVALSETAALRERLARAEAERATARDALADMLAGWRYIRAQHGDLYGVGWDRCEQAATAALATPTPGASDAE